MIERRTQAGDVAFLLEPDLKDGHGGLRDVQTLWWAADADLLVPRRRPRRARRAATARSSTSASPCTASTGRPGDVLRLEDQDAVAAAVGAASADDLMADVAAAGPHASAGSPRARGGTCQPPPASATRSASATGSSSSTARSS